MSYASNVLNKLKEQYPSQTLFHQAVEEVFESLEPALQKDKRYESYSILERLTIPDREILFSCKLG